VDAFSGRFPLKTDGRRDFLCLIREIREEVPYFKVIYPLSYMKRFQNQRININVISWMHLVGRIFIFGPTPVYFII
jgi:hypothetical protein